MRSGPPDFSELVAFEVDGVDVKVRLAGERDRPAIVLVHGFPASSLSFRSVVDTIARSCFVIAPDLPGFGATEPIAQPSFERYARLVDGLLAQLDIGSFHLFLHDFGAAVGLHLAIADPDRVRSLVIQNANARQTGMGPAWAATKAFWEDPSPEREAEATAHLTRDGVRDQYVGAIPDDVAERIDPARWREDWRIMCLPGRLETQRALVSDYRNHEARFGVIADYLERWQPPALMLWGRHDVFFDIDETLSWMKALPRMEAHILDGPHFLLETHPDEYAVLISEFVRRIERG